jgi:hemolysin III
MNMNVSVASVTKVRPSLEEILNAVTHGIGAALSVAALVGMLFHYANGGVWHLTSCLVYGISLILLYLASTLYHSFTNIRLKEIFKFIDHASIYVLIAGNYTPFALLPLHGSLGWTIFGVVWALAVAGIIFQLFCVKRFRILGTFCYLGMGWFAVVMVQPLLALLPVEAVYWLVAGGLLYTVGAVFYLVRSIPYNHVVWHLFVMAGSAAHFWTIFHYVLPVPEVMQQFSELGMALSML